MSTVKQILRLHISGTPIKSIAKIVGVSKNTVKSYLRSSQQQGLQATELLEMDDKFLEELIGKFSKAPEDTRYPYFKSRLAYWEKELTRTGVTRYLLWQEYRLAEPAGYSYSQFCHHLQEQTKSRQSSMLMHHQPAQKLFIDFSGKKMSYYDALTGEEKKAEMLIGVLGYSQRAFIVGIESQKSEDFMVGMNKMLGYLGGVTAAIVPDNMKTAVIKSDRYEPCVNQIFEDFANHYQASVLPTRALHPKNKALAENFVKISYSRVFAPLRDRVFTSLHELNQAVLQQLEAHNNTLFQGKDYSRNDLFESDEKALLKPLPEEFFIVKKYRQYTVHKNSHILLSEDSHYYSVPYAYLGQKVDVVYTHKQVNIYHKGKQLTTHVRTQKKHAYTTLQEHLPSKYRDYKDRSPDYYRSRAGSFCPELLEVINKLLLRKLHVEQNYKSCDGVLRLATKTPVDIFQNACRLAIAADSCHYKFIDQVIANGAARNYAAVVELPPNPQHENIRGKSFFKQLISIIV